MRRGPCADPGRGRTARPHTHPAATHPGQEEQVPPRKKPAPKKPTLDELLALPAEQSRPETVVSLCLRGDLRAEWDRLKAEFDSGPADDEPSTMAVRAAKRRIADQLKQVEDEMRAATVQFRLRALPRKRLPGMAKEQVTWHELVERHPPRTGPDGKPDKRDATLGVNITSFFDELVRVSIVEPVLSDEQWLAFNERVTDAQWDELTRAAWGLNRSGVDVPFSRAASIIRRLDDESRRQNDSESASNASKGGNPSK